jgi:ParB-like chromosome segregation protein Spo0J
MIHIPLSQIEPNPWQTRQSLDEFHVRDLAVDIASRKASRPETLGLLQVPAARFVPGQSGDGARVQLAYGHNRLAAFRLLAQGDDDAFPGDPDYAQMPLDLVSFDDEEMATSAWTENAARKDLTPIEEALAFQHMLESFSWTQAQLADRLGLDRSTIANKLRLLRLPDDVQIALQQRQLSERQAVALMPVLSLPEPAQAKANTHWSIKPRDLLESAINDDLSSNDIRDRANNIVTNATTSLKDVPFPLDHWFEVDDEQATRLQQHACADCAIRVKHGNQQRCPDESCLNLKQELWADLCLTQAEAASGIPRLDPAESNYNTRHAFYSADEATLLAEILDEGCPHQRLRLEYDRNPFRRQSDSIPGFEDVRVVCHHGEGERCTCIASKKAAQTRERNASDPDLQARREREKLVHQLADPAFQALANALAANHLGVWRLLLARLNHAYTGKGQDWNLDYIQYKIASELLPNLRWQHDQPKPAQSTIAHAFEELGLPLPWPDSVRKTHAQLASELNVPINAIALIREILSGTSAESRHFCAIHDPNRIEAALELARHRRCDADTQLAITPDLVAAIERADNSAPGPNSNPLDKINRQFDRIREWYLALPPDPDPRAIVGNITNLQRLRDELRECPPSDQHSVLATLIIALQSKLETLRDQTSPPQGGTEGGK